MCYLKNIYLNVFCILYDRYTKICIQYFIRHIVTELINQDEPSRASARDSHAVT